MDNGYRELEQGEIIQQGDEWAYISDLNWEKPEQATKTVGLPYNHSKHSKHRRPIANDEPEHYSSDTKPVVDKLGMFDACANNENETVCAMCGDVVIPSEHDCGIREIGANVNDTDVVDMPEGQSSAAIKTLDNLGYTYHGGEFWKPPIGKAPEYITESQWLPEVGEECLLRYFKKGGQIYNEFVIAFVEARAFNGDFIIEDSEDGLLHRIPEDMVSDNLRPIDQQVKAEEILVNNLEDLIVKASNTTLTPRGLASCIITLIEESGIDLSPVLKEKDDE